MKLRFQVWLSMSTKQKLFHLQDNESDMISDCFNEK
jgi:hypothetical protein